MIARRGFLLLGLTSMSAWSQLPPNIEAIRKAAFEEAIRKVVGNAVVRQGKVKLDVPPLIIALYGLGVLLAGALRFWRETGGGLAGLIDFGALWRATQDAFGLVYMKGGGAGCNYPDANFSQSRRWFHHLVFYGFLLDLASTTIAAFYDHFLGWQAPYPLLSWPVTLGTIGGVGLVLWVGLALAGCAFILLES